MIRSRDVPLGDALRFYPFEGDETDTRLLSDKIVTARRMHPRCQICEGEIGAGERHRAMTEINRENGQIMTFRFCNRCCRAMAHPDTFDTGRLINSRYSVGEHRRSQKLNIES